MSASASAKSHPVEILQERYAWHIAKLGEIFADPAFLQLTRPTEDELPQAQIAQFFENADTMLLNANLGKYERAFTRFVCNLFCFKIQVFDKTRPTRLWNALDEPFAAFAARVRKLDFQISETPYPPSEVIISWLELQG